MRDLTQKTLSSKRLHAAAILNLDEDEVLFPDGRLASRYVVRKGSGAVIIPLSERGTIYLVRQWRHPVAQALLELPAGVIDEGELPEQAAQRELQEETGFRARKLIHLVSSYTAVGFCDEMLHFYLATELEPSSLEADSDEDIELVEMTIDEAENNPVVRLDAKSVLGLLLARNHLQQAKHDP